MDYYQIVNLHEQDIQHTYIALLTQTEEHNVSLICANADLEARMAGLGYKRFIERQEALKARGKPCDTNALLDFVYKTIKPVADAITTYVDTYPKSRESKELLKYDPHALALSAIRLVLTHSMNNPDKPLKYTTATIKILTNLHYDMDDTLAAKAGRIVIDCLLQVCSEFFSKELISDITPPYHKVYVISTNETFYDWEDTHSKELAELSIMYRPMVIPPRPWGGISNGGYYNESLQRPFIRNRRKLPLSKYGPQAIPKIYEAVNRIQATAFAINTYVLDTALELKHLMEDSPNPEEYSHDKFLQINPERPNSHSVKNLVKAIQDIQESLGLSQEAYKSQDVGKKTFSQWVRDKLLQITDKKAHEIKCERETKFYDLVQLLKYRKACTSIKSKNRLINTALSVAVEYRKYEAIYFPHNLDWRSRTYPLTSGLTTQGIGLQKALLKFSKGKPIGSNEVLEFLLAHTAACYGLDKDTWPNRIKWTEDNREYIQKIADNPVDTYSEWKDTDSPWAFIAACNAMATYYRDGLDGIVDISIPLDGTCNGAQHYAAMTRDSKGADGVNVMPAGTWGVRERLSKLRAKLSKDVRA